VTTMTDVWPARLEEFWSWHADAACREADSSLFYSPDGERGPTKERRERAAKAVCADCSVRELCASFALANREPYGTWGGISENDRRELWRRVNPHEALRAYRDALAAWEDHQLNLMEEAVRRRQEACDGAVN
jgi:WhiB family transcriptional regulator, redox-sensing transcriptional regulator